MTDNSIGQPSDYLVVEDLDKPSTWHLRVKREGVPDHHLMGAAWAALHEGYRGNRYTGPDKDRALRKLKRLYAQEGLPLPRADVKHIAPEIGWEFVCCKSVDERVAVVEGWGIRFGGRDMTGDEFTVETDLGLDLVPDKPVYYDHALREVKHPLGRVTRVERLDGGIWVEAELDRNAAYVDLVLELIEEGALGWSSGSVPHLVERDGGVLKRWPIVEFSLTPTPAEPRVLGVEWTKEMPDDSRPAIPSGNAESSIPGGLRDELHGRIQTTENRQQMKDHGQTGQEGEPSRNDSSLYSTARPQQRENKNAETNLVTCHLPRQGPAGSAGTPAPFSKEESMETQEAKEQSVERKGAAAIDEETTGTATLERVRQIMQEEIKAAFAGPAVNAGGVLSAPALKRVTDLGFSQDEKKSFLHWVRTGDTAAVKAALQEDTSAEGGYLVPNDLLKEIAAKRDEVSIARQCGARVIQTGLKIVDIPAEDTKLTNFVLTAEEAAADEAEQTFAQIQVTAYKYTRLIKVSDELLADNQTNLEAYLNAALGRAWGLTENAIFLVGSGTGQPQGAVIGATKGKDAAANNAIAAGEVMDLYFSLTSPYRDGAVFCMHGDVEAHIRSLTGSPWLFLGTPQGSMDSLIGKRVFNSGVMDTIGSSKKTILFGNWEYYALVERQGLVVQRNPYLYQATGQVGLFATVRTGGKVLQSEAFKYLQQAV